MLLSELLSRSLRCRSAPLWQRACSALPKPSPPPRPGVLNGDEASVICCAVLAAGLG